MMKKIFITMVTLALCGGVAFSQGHIDAHRLGQNELNGTARYLGMGGAFGALGGDVSAMKSNPAGLAVYRTSEVVTTLSLNTTSTQTDWLGTAEKNNRTHFNFDNIAYVGYFPTGKDEGVIGWNVGFAYNRLKNYRRSYKMSHVAGSSSSGGIKTSLSDYMAERAYGNPSNYLAETSSNDPYEHMTDWLSVLGYNAGIIKDFNANNKEYYSVFGDYNDKDEWVPYSLYENNLEVYESGAIDQYDISFGINISDIVMLGATIAVTDITYDLETRYDELFEYEGNDFFLDNGLSTDGTGYSFNVGAIIRPTDFLRVGVAYNSPTWYKMTDFYYGSAASAVNYYENGELIQENISAKNTPTDAYTDYEFRSPDKWIFSLAGIFGRSALLSVDYELTNYQNMNMRYSDGTENTYTNSDIKTDFGSGQTIRIGGEYKVTPQFSVRAGGGWSKTPMKAHLLDGQTEVHTVGTVPHYTLDRGSSYYSIGIGYRFTPNFYTDLAYVHTQYKEDVYAFSDMFIGENENRVQIIDAQPASMKTNNSRVALTFGYKF